MTEMMGLVVKDFKTIILNVKTIIKEILGPMNYGRKFVTLYRRQGSRPSPWKRNAKNEMAV